MGKKGCRVDIAKLPKKYQDQIKEQLYGTQSNRNSSAVRDSVKKHGGQNAPHETVQVSTFRSPCIVSVHVWKCGGNWDACNIETKEIIDGLVKSGVLTEDTIKEVPEVRKRGSRCKTKAEERTVVIISNDIL